MSLNIKALEGLKPTGQRYRLTDENGLYIEVTPSGGKLWRFKYRFAGKQKILALGKYPDVKLAKAREKRQEARALLADGIDPMQDKKKRLNHNIHLESLQMNGGTIKKTAGVRIMRRLFIEG